jgi:phosphoribosylformylglycinamidine synthase
VNGLAPLVPLGALREAALERRLRELGVPLRTEEVRVLVGDLGRDPTQAELVLFAGLWSEHCSYKSSRELLGRLPTRAANVVLGPGADAGVVRLPRLAPDGTARVEDASPAPDGGSRCIALGHESHNHPSQLLPYEGAATGIGGIVRDVYCMGADVIGVLDGLRFGDPAGTQGETVLQIARGVVRGVAGYGNALGVPNLGGDVEFDAGFDDNCLVNVVALGMLDERDLIPSVAPAAAAREEYVLVLVGKPTDDSGLGGAAFASGVLDTDEKTQQRGAVQLPDPFFKRVLTEANKVAFDVLRRHGAPFAVKDLGAAGLGGASAEMAAGGGLGLDLDLDAVHRVRAEEAAHVLLVAETQERYVLAVPAGLVPALLRIYEIDFELGGMVRGAGARVVGRFRAEPRYRVLRRGVRHVDVPSALVVRAPIVHWPRVARPAAAARQRGAPAIPRRDLAADLRRLVESAALASRHRIFQHYDSDVQGRSVLRPGDGDAGVLLLRRDEPLAVAVGLGGAARWGARDAYRAGVAAVCEAARNVAAVGATPWALTDCLNFGSPENPRTMQDLEDAVRGLADAARALGLRGHPGEPLPFVSGNVSLYNESRAGRAIPPLPLVACLGVACDVARVRGLRLKQPGDDLWRLAEPRSGLGSSLWARAAGLAEVETAGELPPLDPDRESARILAVLDAFDAGLVQACHDLGDGGLALVLAEMAFGRRGEPALGVRCRLPGDATAMVPELFAESTGFVLEIAPEHAVRFEAVCAGHGLVPERLGTVVDRPQLVVLQGGAEILAEGLDTLAALWRRGLHPVFDEGRPA